MKPVLLLVDLQHDYLRAPDLAPHANALTAQAALLLSGFRQATLPVVHAWTTVDRAPDDRMPHWKARNQWQCVRGTEGHLPPEALRPLPSESVVHKQFFSAFGAPELDGILARTGADTVVLAGLHLHACLRATALDGYQRGFHVWMADDAVASDDPVHAAITRRYLSARAIRFLPVSQLLRGLQPEASPEPRAAEAVPDASSIHPTVLAARAAAPRWRSVTEADRAAVLRRLADRIAGQTGWAEEITRETGKPIRYAREEVGGAIAQLRAIAARSESEPPRPVPTGPHARRCPLGVVALITPWNNPLFLPLGKLAPALLHGNVVVWKPAPAGHRLAVRVLAELVQCGLPPDVASVLPGDRSIAEQLMAHPGVDAVTLTGSLSTGYSAQEICARRHVPFQAELGGNNAAIVWSDADLPTAAAAIAEGAFAMAGQRCTANRRALVHRDVLEVFLAELSRATTALPTGDPFHPETRIGPMISAAARDRIATATSRADGRGLRRVRLDGAWLDEGNHHPPVIVVCGDPNDELVQEETFGPLLVVQPVSDWSQAIVRCNGVRQGLAAALFSRSAELHRGFLEEVRAGILKINRTTAGADIDLPFGGWKASGIGPAEHGESDQEFFTRVQAVYP